MSEQKPLPRTATAQQKAKGRRTTSPVLLPFPAGEKGAMGLPCGGFYPQGARHNGFLCEPERRAAVCPALALCIRRRYVTSRHKCQRSATRPGTVAGARNCPTITELAACEPQGLDGAPTLEQIKHVINTMPATTDIERRNRALIAFTLLTGARDSAIASMKLKHVDLIANSVNQDAREVKTKFSKSFTTYFFPVGDDIHGIVAEWVTYLRENQLWGNDDPLFPATCVALGAARQFEVAGLKQDNWGTASPIRAIFREAFVNAGLPYFNPHSFRNTLVQLGEKICKTPEDFKSWSQNLGHEKVLTTFTSYGEVACQRQGEIIRGLATPQLTMQSGADEFAEAVFKKLRGSGIVVQANSV